MKRLIFCFFQYFFLTISVALADHVAPLLDGWVRQQKDPFNRCCPFYIDNGVETDTRCQVGCVATSLESIISYHRREIVLQDVLPAWCSEHFVTTDIPAGTTVDTRLILLDYGDGTAESVGMDEQDYAAAVDAVARLSLMCGMMAKMNWGIGSSGADAGRLVEPLKNVFGWKTAEYIDSYQYTPKQWREILKNELRHGRPILYTGYTMGIYGHAFVVDGYDENDRFHVNWGYSGYYDNNYYDLELLNVFVKSDELRPADEGQGFFCNQQALILSPDEIDMTLIADSIERTGREVVIEDVTIDETPLTGKYTSISVTLHNTADIPLCTPFEIFTNDPDETDIFQEGDYGALFGVTLEPDERRTVTVHCQFSETGHRLLRISPDDVEILYCQDIEVQAGTDDRLAFAPVSIDFAMDPKASDEGLLCATFSIPITNVGTDRAGSLLTYSLFEGQKGNDGDYRHYDYIYLRSGDSETRTVTCRNLVPGNSYYFGVRWPWVIRQDCQFVVPDDMAAVDRITVTPQAYVEGCYDLWGRRASHPDRGLLIHGGRKTIY